MTEKTCHSCDYYHYYRLSSSHCRKYIVLDDWYSITDIRGIDGSYSATIAVNMQESAFDPAHRCEQQVTKRDWQVGAGEDFIQLEPWAAPRL